MYLKDFNKKYFHTLPFFIAAMFMFSCIKNDFPYPIVRMYVTSLTVEGQIGESVISNEKSTVTVELSDTINKKAVHITSLTVTEGGTVPFPTDTVVDMTSPFVFNISMYQDYEWAIIANQNMNYDFKVVWQFGQSSIYPETKEAKVKIPINRSLYFIDIESLKLGPTGALYNGVDVDRFVPDWKVNNNYAEAEVKVTYKDFFSEDWKLYVYLTEDIIFTKSVDAWTRVAWLHGEGVSGMDNGFEYKQKDTEEWIKLDPSNVTENGGQFTGILTHLNPNTTYICRAYSGEKYGDEIEFTTGPEFQPENSSFEYTSGNNPIWIYGDGQSMWWDTGNKGSITMNKNVTTPDTSIKHSGNQSLLLTSQFVGLGANVGKFAAGNLFVGEYLKTDGTDGVLGWGRQCTVRPTAMKLWVKYAPGKDKKYGDYSGLGNKDIGTIYVAVGDWPGQEFEGKKYPIIVKTKKSEQNLFTTEKGTYCGDGIIGYGIKNLEGNYDDNGELKELIIPLDYENYGGYSRVPTHIIIVASASLYGDYFTGFEGSKLWIDDITLEYDYEK